MHNFNFRRSGYQWEKSGISRGVVISRGRLVPWVPLREGDGTVQSVSWLLLAVE